MELTEEKQKVFAHVNALIDKKRDELLKELPDVHEVDDGIIIRFFADWDNCVDDDKIKFKKLTQYDDPNESVVFFFIPKGAFFELKKRFYIGCITCLNGAIDITANNKTRFLKSYSKICVDSDDVTGRAFENTYLITSSVRTLWGDVINEHVKQYQ